MTPQQAYRIDWRKVVSDALPSFLRKPLIIALLLSSLAPLIWLYHRFLEGRLRDFYKLQHNGQVCSLLGVLEEQYPSALGLHYRIEDVKRRGTVIYTHSETRTNVPVAYPEGNRKVLITGSENHGTDPSSFVVYVPQDIYDTKLSEVQWLVDQYRLPTKHPIYIRLSKP